MGGSSSPESNAARAEEGKLEGESPAMEEMKDQIEIYDLKSDADDEWNINAMDAVTDIFDSSASTFFTKPTLVSNYTFYSETALLPQFTGATLVVLAALMTTAAVLITFGNALIFLAFVVDERLRTQSNLYLLSLAVCDFCIGAVSIPFNIPYGLYGTWMFGRAVCKFCIVTDYTACAASVFNIVVISYDRHLSVTNPVAHRAQQTCNTITKITAVWLLAFIIYGPALIFWDIITGQSQVPSDHCYAEFTYSWYFLACLLTCNFFIPFFSVSYFNLGIYWNIRKRMKNRQTKVINKRQSESNSEGEETFLSFIRLYILFLKKRVVCSSVSKEPTVTKYSRQNLSMQKMDKISNNLNDRHISSTEDEQKTPSQNSAVRLSKDKKIAKSLAVLVCIFGICQAPYTFVSIINSTSWTDVGYFWSCITGWIMWLNSLINPLLYPLCHRSFRRAFSKIFCHK
ncbi:histamine H3 receptor-like [Protopterus annectens]|uniref:histamine H3 receptor-like n=1 Tax=Protopterus annectens TaxID=7888 RepID=UPI001CFB3222|nr:histamine H3 receptor-like [Protopterus annectens]